MINTTSTESKLISDVWIWLSVLVSILVTITSLFGILYEKTYFRETQAWALQAIGQDYVNLLVVIILLISTYFVTKYSIKGFLVWLGVYVYLIYAFAIYAFAIHFQFLFLAYVAVLGMSFYALLNGFMKIEKNKAAKFLLGVSKAKIISAFLMIIGVMFSFLWLSEIMPNIFTGTIPQGLLETNLPVNPVHVLDLAFLLPAMFVTSVLLWQKNFWGYVLSIPLLVFTASMGLGIITIFIISAKAGLSYSLPAGIIIGVVILVSSYFLYLLLKKG